jgi:hypothetical protein
LWICIGTAIHIWLAGEVIGVSRRCRRQDLRRPINRKRRNRSGTGREMASGHELKLWARAALSNRNGLQPSTTAAREKERSSNQEKAAGPGSSHSGLLCSVNGIYELRRVGMVASDCSIEPLMASNAGTGRTSPPE